MNTVLIIGSIFLALYFFDKIFLWLEKHRWLYYRNKKSDVGVLGSTLEQMNSFVNPAVRHTIEMKQNQVKIERHTADDDKKD